MTNQRDTQMIDAFVDGELDLAGQLEIEERMRLDPATVQTVQGLRQLRETIREKADYHPVPAALRERISAGLGAAPTATRRPRASVVSALQRWLAWRPMAGSFALAAAAVVALNLAWLHGAQDERVLDDVVASHVRATLGQHLVDVASSDHHTVKPWLSSKLDFSPPVSELQLPGSVFLGGRVDYLDGRPVAALVYRQGPHVVSSFVWPATGKDSKPEFSETRGFQTAHWTHGAMQHWVISDVNRGEFDAVVQAIRAAETSR
jgi:anti-sigma factor RsiW